MEVKEISITCKNPHCRAELDWDEIDKGVCAACDDYVDPSGSDVVCGAEHPDGVYVCTRTKGHTGKHVAHYGDGRFCAVRPWE